jgi:hypothetical protein
MDASEKKRLKKLGKQQVEAQSRELHERLRESNGAPSGSDEWANNYRRATLKEQELRRTKPDIIYASELERDFVLQPIESPEVPVPTIYIECKQCHDVLHSFPTRIVTCSCKSITLSIEDERLMICVDHPHTLQWVKLIGRGNSELGFIDGQDQDKVCEKPWWRFWR